MIAKLLVQNYCMTQWLGMVVVCIANEVGDCVQTINYALATLHVALSTHSPRLFLIYNIISIQAITSAIMHSYLLWCHSSLVCPCVSDTKV